MKKSWTKVPRMGIIKCFAGSVVGKENQEHEGLIFNQETLREVQGR
jgi:hypothetical protein